MPTPLPAASRSGYVHAPHVPCSTADEFESSKTRAILGKIGKLPLLQQDKPELRFIWSDYLLPYHIDQLPEDETDERGPLHYASDFLDAQKNLLSEISFLPRSIHDIIQPSDEKPPPHFHVIDIWKVFHEKEKLGSGRFGDVNTVKLHDIPGTFAMKRMLKPVRRDTTRTQRRSTVEQFKDELHALKECRHRHMIRLRASFTDETYFGFIMSPVAKLTLQKVLNQYVETNNLDHTEDKDSLKTLYHAFGCLLEALRYLHDELHIRHRDLKPSNILVHDRSVLLCDFGSAYHWKPPGERDSTDESRAGTRKYKAPEVGSSGRQKHNRKGDIFSLACIFLEMYTVLKSKTLNRMARKVTQCKENVYAGDWTYASSLDGVNLWLRELQQDEPNGQVPAPGVLIGQMLCETGDDRKSAKELLDQVRSKYHKYICKDCNNQREDNEPLDPVPTVDRPSSPDREPVPMEYSTPIPVTLCKIGRREQDRTSNKKPEYGPYSFDYKHECVLEIQKLRNGAQWATTRSIIIRPSRDGSPEDEWLPAYSVQVRQDGRKVSFKWSNCDQIERNVKNYVFEGAFLTGADSPPVLYLAYLRQVHYHSQSRANRRMEVDCINESDAQNLCELLLREPTDSHALCEIQKTDQELVTIRKFDWEYEKQSIKGSRIVSLLHPRESRQYRRLLSLFVPQNLDFTWTRDKDQKHVILALRSLYVPKYKSNLDREYEYPEEMALPDGVELMQRSENLHFEEGSGETLNTNIQKHAESRSPHHLKPEPPSKSTLLHFISTLTGWEFIAAFSAEIWRTKSHFSLSGLSHKGHADVLCCRKGTERHVAMRWNVPNSQTTVWTTATLVKIPGLREYGELEVELVSFQDGQLLDLAKVIAAGSRTKNFGDKSEIWRFQVVGGSAIPSDYNECNIANPPTELVRVLNRH